MDGKQCTLRIDIPSLRIFFYIIFFFFFFFTPPSTSRKLLLHPTQSLSRTNSPYNFSTAKLPFVNHDSSRTINIHLQHPLLSLMPPTSLRSDKDDQSYQYWKHTFVTQIISFNDTILAYTQEIVLKTWYLWHEEK